MIKKPPPTVLPGKNVFLETYSNSPEWTRFENPVVYMEEEVLPEELDGGRTPEQPQDEELSAAWCEGRQPEAKDNQSRRHPLSQVANAEDMVSPLSNDMQPPIFGQHGHGRPGAPISTSDNDEETEDFLTDDDVDEEEPSNDEGDLGEEEPQDDTFDFLRR